MPTKPDSMYVHWNVPPLQIVHRTVERPMEVDEEAAAIGDGGDLAPRAVGHEPHELLRVVLVEPVQHQQRMAFEVRQRRRPSAASPARPSRR